MNHLSILRVWIYTFTSTFSQLYAPIIFLFFDSRGVNTGQVGILFAIGSIISRLTEVPFGVFSDNYSKKLSVILGGLCTIVGLIIYINGYGFTQMAIAIGLISIGDSGKSGTVQAILVNTLREQNDFFQINNYTTYIANALSAVIIGFLFKINHQYPFYISLSCEIILIFLILTIKNKDQIPTQKNTLEEDNKLNLKTVLYFFSKYKFH